MLFPLPGTLPLGFTGMTCSSAQPRPKCPFPPHSLTAQAELWAWASAAPGLSLLGVSAVDCNVGSPVFALWTGSSARAEPMSPHPSCSPQCGHHPVQGTVGVSQMLWVGVHGGQTWLNLSFLFPPLPIFLPQSLGDTFSHLSNLKFCLNVCVSYITALLQCKLPTMQFIHLKCTSQWFLVYSELYNHHYNKL